MTPPKIGSPYAGKSTEDWDTVTAELISKHPLKTDDIVRVTLQAWNDIFVSKLGSKPFQIGVDFFPKPQIMGFLLHEMIPLQLAVEYPGLWRAESTANEKDLVYIPDPAFSVEIKTSSNPSKIFGNRSYAQKSTSDRKTKDKSGYYLAVNFEGFTTDRGKQPRIMQIRFGWLDHADWAGQKAATGQQAHLSVDVEKHKLHILHEASPN